VTSIEEGRTHLVIVVGGPIEPDESLTLTSSNDERLAVTGEAGAGSPSGS
jgi:hypothetical protein